MRLPYEVFSRRVPCGPYTASLAGEATELGKSFNVGLLFQALPGETL